MTTIEIDPGLQADVDRLEAQLDRYLNGVCHTDVLDITGDHSRSLAAVQRELGASVRLTNRQSLVFRDLSESQLAVRHQRLDAIGMDEVGGGRTNISGCTNSCGQHHPADVGFFGAERRAHGQSAPDYQMLLSGHVADTGIEFGRKALRLPARNAPEAAVRVVDRSAAKRDAGETFRTWLDRVGSHAAGAEGFGDLDHFPRPGQNREFYVDFDETGPYVAEIGDSECAT